MVDPERLAAFVAMTAASSLVPGVSMLFVMAQTIRRDWRTGAAALAGMQLGYLGWWALAALGLGTLASAFPLAFRVLGVGGALYLAWLGGQSIRDAGGENDETTSVVRRDSRHAWRDGILVALGNPKSLIYIVALVPPFVDARDAVVPQLVILALVAMLIDVLVGAVYIAAGKRFAALMARPAIRHRVDLATGLLFFAIAAGLLADLAAR
jgi:threonine/homoserine/homoserine lactone efflux protein